jgi:hypothetical protein
MFLRDGVRFGPLVHCTVAVSRAPDTRACYVFPVAAHHPRLVCLTFEHNKLPGRAPEGKGMVGIYPTLGIGRRGTCSPNPRHRHERALGRLTGQ